MHKDIGALRSFWEWLFPPLPTLPGGNGVSPGAGQRSESQQHGGDDDDDEEYKRQRPPSRQPPKEEFVKEERGRVGADVGPGEGQKEEASAGQIRRATDYELEKAAKDAGYDRVEDWKQDELRLKSDSDIGIDKDGNLYAAPRQGGKWQSIDVKVSR